MIQHDLTYKWADGASTLTAVRSLTAAAAAQLDLAAPNASRNLPAAFTLARAKVKLIVLLSDQPVTFRAGGTSAVQSVTVTGTTGGTFTLTSGGLTTAAVPWNATAAQVQSALVALASVGPGGAAVTGGPLPGSAASVAFGALVALQPLALMVADASLLTGGAPAVAVATTTAGANPDTTVALLAGVPLVWDAAGYAAQPFAADVATVAVTNTSGSGATVKLRTLSDA